VEKLTKVNDIPKLNPNVIIQPFDSSTNKEKYLVILGKQQWIISSTVMKVINCIDGKKNIDDIVSKLESEEGISKETSINVINNILRKNKILDSDEIISKPINTNKSLWFRMDFLKPEFIKKFAFLSNLYNEKTLFFCGLISIFSQIYILCNSLSNSGINKMLKSDWKLIFYMLITSLIIAMVHEFGHSCAAMKYGVEPGNIGFGIYFMMPVFYSDVTNVWKIDRKKRVIVDLGGMYFQSLFTFILLIIATIINNKYMFVAISIITINNINNFNPFIKLDGYWMFSDAIGIPNLHKVILIFVKNKLKLNISEKEKSVLNSFVYDIKKREKILFKLYLFLGIVFILYIVYFLSIMSINCYSGIMTLISTVMQSNTSIIISIKIIIKWILNNIMYVFFIIYIIRLVFSAIKKLIFFIIGKKRK